MSGMGRTWRGRKDGGHCCYCKRQLTASTDRAGTAFTFDHVLPVTLGGTRRVPCCRTCNTLKGDLLPREWFVFIDANARWWATFRSNNEVRRWVAGERARRARLAIIRHGEPEGGIDPAIAESLAKQSMQGRRA